MKNQDIVRSIAIGVGATKVQHTFKLTVEHLSQEDIEYYAISDMIVKAQGPVRNLLQGKTEKLPDWLKYDKATKTVTATIEPKGSRSVSEATVEKAASLFSKLDETGKLNMLKSMFPDKTDDELAAMLAPVETPVEEPEV